MKRISMRHNGRTGEIEIGENSRPKEKWQRNGDKLRMQKHYAVV